MAVTTEKYTAIVTSNEDEEFRGRIKVACPDILPDIEDAVTELPDWVEPCLDWGWFYVPDVGEQVELEMDVASSDDESNMQTSLDVPRLRWRGKREYTQDSDLEADHEVRLPHKDFETNYGKRRGFATPWGHILMFDDTEGDPRIYLTWMKEQLEPGVEPEEEKWSRIEIEPDGSLKVGLLKKHLFHFETEGNKVRLYLDEEKHKLDFEGDVPSFTVSLDEGKYAFTIDNSQFSVALDSGSTVVLEGKDGDAKLTLGDGAKSAVIAEHLKEYIDNTVKKEIDAHIHPTGMGPSGTPPKPMTPYASNITSTKVKIPDG